jgi:hypothetical protein
MSNRKKIPYVVMAMLYTFLFLGVVGGFFALAMAISFSLDIDIFVVLAIEAILLLASSYAFLNYISNFDELDITFDEDDDKETML